MTNNKVAVLITGTYREIEFLLQLFPYMAGSVDYDIFLVLRHVRTDEQSRLGASEQDFKIANIEPLLREKNIYCSELPSINPAVVQSEYLIPVGPTGKERECGMISMFTGVFTAISMLKSSMREYTHVMKTRTDYLPWITPWIDGLIETYKRSDNKIIIDGAVTKPQRYPDRLDIPWQGSINDQFCFASIEQFLKLWDFEGIFNQVWTGIPETTLFRAAILRFLGDTLQSPRRNRSFLEKYFIWEPNDTKQSFNMLRSGVLSKDLKKKIMKALKNQEVSIDLINKLIRSSYDFIVGKTTKQKFKLSVDRCFMDKTAISFMEVCKTAVNKARPV